MNQINCIWKKHEKKCDQLPLHEVSITDWSPHQQIGSTSFASLHNLQRYRRIEQIVEDSNDYGAYQPNYYQPYSERWYFTDHPWNQPLKYDMPTSLTVKNPRNWKNCEHFTHSSYNQTKIHRKQNDLQGIIDVNEPK